MHSLPADPSLIDSRQAAWRLLATLGLVVLGNSSMYIVSVVLPAVQTEFGVGRADASLPYTLMMVCLGLGGLITGRLAAALGLAYRPAAPLGPVSVSARLKAGATSAELTEMKASAGPSSLAGTAKADFGGARPRLSADLVADELVLQSFLPAKKSASLSPDESRQNARLREAARRLGEIRESDWISRVSASRRDARRRSVFGICRCVPRCPRTGPVR